MVGKQFNNSEEESILDDILALEADRIKFKPRDPPPQLQAFIEQASLEQLQGVLIEVLAAMKDCGWAVGGLLTRCLMMMVGDENQRDKSELL